MALTPHQISLMREGGHRLGKVKGELGKFTQVGMSFAEVEAEAQRLIKAADAKPNFAMVPGYHWATCIMRNDEVCHGIPSAQKHVEDGDLITIDVGLLYQGVQLDTTTSFIAGTAKPSVEKFLEVGKRSLANAIAAAVPGNSVYDISLAMETPVLKAGCGLVYQLTGHGIGLELHEDPMIPCFANKRDKKHKLFEGQTLAIEVMYTMGKPDLQVGADGWTYSTIDGSLAGMIEETVLVTANGREILTR